MFRSGWSFYAGVQAPLPSDAIVVHRHHDIEHFVTLKRSSALVYSLVPVTAHWAQTGEQGFFTTSGEAFFSYWKVLYNIFADSFW